MNSCNTDIFFSNYYHFSLSALNCKCAGDKVSLDSELIPRVVRDTHPLFYSQSSKFRKNEKEASIQNITLVFKYCEKTQRQEHI